MIPISASLQDHHTQLPHSSPDMPPFKNSEIKVHQLKTKFIWISAEKFREEVFVFQHLTQVSGLRLDIDHINTP